MTLQADAISLGCHPSACVLPATQRRMRQVHAPQPKATKARPAAASVSVR